MLLACRRRVVEDRIRGYGIVVRFVVVSECDVAVCEPVRSGVLLARIGIFYGSPSDPSPF